MPFFALPHPQNGSAKVEVQKLRLSWHFPAQKSHSNKQSKTRRIVCAERSGLRESRLHEGAGGSLMPLAPAGDHEIPLTFTANPAASFVPDTDKSEVEVGIGGGGSSRRMKLTARRVSISCPGSAHRDTELIRRARLNSRDSPLQWAPSPPSPYMFAHANGDFGKTHDGEFRDWW